MDASEETDAAGTDDGTETETGSGDAGASGIDLVGVTRAALASGPLCDPCLGRLVADRSFGLTNAGRGRAMRTALALAADEPFESADVADCWVCEGETDRFAEFATRARRRLEPYEIRTYQVGTKIPPLFEENERLLREEAGLSADAGEPLNREFNREVGRRLGEAIAAEVDLERPDALVVLDLATDEIDLQVNSAFVYGRYRKTERGLPQTKWPCSDCDGTGQVRGAVCDTCAGSGFRYSTSVEQEVAPAIRERMDGAAAVFHGAGREDVDALMLGTGRPFVVEVKEPHRRALDWAILEERINERATGVTVTGLRPATYDMVERVKGLDAAKRYRARVRFDEPVTAAALTEAIERLCGTTVAQRTPERVRHRRADIVRERTVYDIEARLTEDTADDAGIGGGEDTATTAAEADGRDPRRASESEPTGGTTTTTAETAARSEKPSTSRSAVVELHGEGGLYVKELISGDDGRTDPSLAGLLEVTATVQTLDVVAVEGEEEPFEQPAFIRSELESD